LFLIPLTNINKDKGASSNIIIGLCTPRCHTDNEVRLKIKNNEAIKEVHLLKEKLSARRYILMEPPAIIRKNTNFCVISGLKPIFSRKAKKR